MATDNRIPPSIGRRRKTAIWLAVAAGVLVFIGANAHLVYVAVTSQPECVAHRAPGGSVNQSSFSAAESACTPAAQEAAGAQQSP